MAPTTQTIAALVLAAIAPSGADKVTPIQSVLGMLGDMKVKGEKMLEEEQKVFASYTEFVDDRERELGYEMKTANSDIEKLVAFIEDADSKVKTLGDEIAGLDDDISRLEGELKAATSVRGTEKADFETAEQDLSESVDAIGRALQVLQTQQGATPQASAALLQQMAGSTPGMDRVMALLQAGGGDAQEADETGAPAAAGYESQSGGIVEMLEGLLKKFKGELSELQEEESNKAHYYDLTKIHLTDTIAQSTADRQSKAATKGKTTAASARANGDLGDTKNALAEDKKELADMKASFEAKSATYKENQVVRADELKALAKTIEIISSPDVSGGGSLAQVPAAGADRQVSFLQLASRRAESRKQEVVSLLKRRAGELNSKALAAFAAGVAGNPFEKVIGMIEAMLEKLKEEAAAEAEHKGFCDEELKKNKLKRNKQSATVAKLSAEIEGLAGDIASMGKQIDTLVQEQADLAKAMTTATDERATEHATNTEAIAEAQTGAVAVQKALAVLREFYSSQAGFLQRRSSQEPYKGMQNAKDGPIGMLEVIETDFKRVEADTTAAEAEAVRVYDQFMADSTEGKKQRHEQEVKTRLAKDEAEFQQSQTKKDLVANEDELGMANKYYGELKPMCTEVHVSYEERVRQREAELASLNEAYEILDQKR